MTSSLAVLTLEVTDLTAAERFYAESGLGAHVRLRAASDEPSEGFRSVVLSLVVAQPADVRALVDAAVAAGATALKPAAKSFWGYSGVVRTPDGTIWKFASSEKKDTGPATGQVDKFVLLLGATDVAATRKFYVEQGLTVAKSFGRKYVEFAAAEGTVSLALYGRRALAKDVGVPVDGTGSHRIVLGGDAGSFDDPDGFAWEPADIAAAR
ncbi:glyoxalase [Yinghuangia seranimata]|uniref:glyoxalase n=1 Tax=Yinghuangia seranimata TaxID=408067 RepID=UPI00248C19EA|nr:glyoxalase [Yinghuangia seranimata]MDI2128511.1 glyoxalase [Yinghuangia seranimata]